MSTSTETATPTPTQAAAAEESHMHTAHPATSDYLTSGFSNKMGWGTRPALLLIDICAAYWTLGSPLDISSNPSGASSLSSMRRLLSAARESSPRVPIIWTTVSYTHPQMADAGLFYKKAKMLTVWRKGDKRGLAAWMEGLEPREEEGETMIVKKYASAFFGTTLASELQNLGVDTLVICGVSTSGCVRASTLDAMQHGFRPMVVGSACGDRTPQIQQANLFDMNAKYADVVEEDEAIEKLRTGWQ